MVAIFFFFASLHYCIGLSIALIIQARVVQHTAHRPHAVHKALESPIAATTCYIFPLQWFF